MHARLKMMTVLVTMVAVFAMLPALSAVAAEPLEDGPYTVVVAERSLPMTVVDGEALVPARPGIEWQFSYDETGRVLDEFFVVVDGATYKVEVGEDSVGYATLTDEAVEPPPADTLAGEDLKVDDEGEEPAEIEESEEPEDETEDAGHGELVSAVAQCAPNGREAREAGLPNHGAIVSAVAKGGEGELISFTVPTFNAEAGTVDEAGTPVVITQDMSAADICTALEDALAIGTEAAEKAAELEGETEDTKGKPAKAEKADGEAPGKSGEAPGKGKKNAED